MGPHIINTMWPLSGFELTLLPRQKLAFGTAIPYNHLAAKHSIERNRTVFLYSRSEVSVCDSLSDGSLSDSLSHYGGVIPHSNTK